MFVFRNPSDEVRTKLGEAALKEIGGNAKELGSMVIGWERIGYVEGCICSSLTVVAFVLLYELVDYYGDDIKDKVKEIKEKIKSKF